MRMRAATGLWAALMVAWAAGGAQAAEIETLPTGADAPDFALPGVDGKTYALADFEGAEVLAVIFTCNHCPTVQAYEARIQRLTNDYKDKGVAVVAISPNDPLAVRLDELGYSDLNDGFEDMQLRAAEAGFTFPYLYDGDIQAVSKAYGPVSTPHVFVFDRDRKLRYTGRIDDNEHPDRVKTHDMRNAIEALLAGRPVPVERTKTVGCSVKWSDKRDTVAEALARWAKEPVSLDTIGADGVKGLVRNEGKNLRLINAWATWCGPCVAEFPDLIEMHRMYRGRDFELVTISADPPGDRARVLAFLEKHEASTRNFLFDSDDTYAFVEALDSEWAGAFPHTLLVAPGGEVIYRHTGRFDPLEVKRAIVGYLGRTYK